MTTTQQEFLARIAAKQQANEEAVQVEAARQKAVREADYAEIREAAKTLIPDFLVEKMVFDDREYDGVEEVAELTHPYISGIQIFFAKVKDQWVAGKEYNARDRAYHFPYRYKRASATGQETWLNVLDEDFDAAWLLAANAKQQAVQQQETVRPPLLNATLALDKFSNHYRVELTPEEATQFIERANAQCECWSAEIVRFLHAINDAVPPIQFGEGNPNNGRMHHRFLIGREYTRVIYLDIATAYLENTISDWTAFSKEILAIGERYHAAEFDLYKQGEAGLLFRFWWKRCDRCDEDNA